jgi:hypothetical protein
MSGDPVSPAGGSPARPDPPRDPTIWDPEVERPDEDECRRLMSAGGVGRLACSGRQGLAVLPVGYKVDQGSIVFRTPRSRPADNQEGVGRGDQGASGDSVV